MHTVKDKFIKEVIECLQEEEDIVVPYLIAPLIQEIDNNTFHDFFEDLNSRGDFFVEYEPDSTGGYTNGNITVYLTENQIGGMRFNHHILKYCYIIGFGIDERHDGCCECSPNDEGYRKDKKCCGYSCDWDAPTITLQKVETLVECSYNGNERNYWDFEDGYYALDDEANRVKIQREKAARITYLKENISKMQMELAELA